MTRSIVGKLENPVTIMGVDSNGYPVPQDITTTSDGSNAPLVVAEAGFTTAESITVGAGNVTVTINGGTAKGMYVGTTGNMTVVTPNGETITYTNLPVGFHPIPFTSTVDATCTAGGIIAGAW